MGTPFTHTTWQVRPGLEDEFVERWREWAEWSHRQGLRAHARLLRDDVCEFLTLEDAGPGSSLDRHAASVAVGWAD